MPDLTQGDTGYGFRITLEDENGPVNLSGTTVLFLMGEYEILADIVDAVNGIALVTFNSTHTAQYGDYQALCRVEYPDGNVEHHPSKGYINVSIKKGVG